MKYLAAVLLACLTYYVAIAEQITYSPSGAIISGSISANDLVCGAGGAQVQDCVNASAGYASLPLGLATSETFTSAPPPTQGLLQVIRTANYSGGTAGDDYNAIFAHTIVSSGVANYEWAILGQVDNSATGGQNVGGYFQGNIVTTGVGPTWGAVAQCQDESGTVNPTQGCIGIEVDVGANSTDSNLNRIGVHIVGQNYGSGSDTAVGYGIRLTPAASGTFVNGIFLDGTAGSTYTTAAISTPDFTVDGSGNVTGLSFIPSGSTVPSNGIYLPSTNVVGFSADSTEIAKLEDVNGGEFVLGSGASTNSSDQLAVGQNANVSRSVSFINTNSGSSATAPILYFGNNASTTEVSMTLNSSGNTGGNGANSFTINAAAGLWLQGDGNNGIELNTSGHIVLFNQLTSGTITYAVCAAANANGTSGGALILDTSSTVCGLSSRRFKEREQNIAPDDALAIAMRLKPERFFYRPEYNQGREHEQIGLIAEDVQFADEDLIERDKNGLPRAVSYAQGIGTVAIGAIQALERRIETLEAKVH